MYATELQDALISILDAISEARDEMDGGNDDGALADLARDMAGALGAAATATSFERAMLLTSDTGLVLRTGAGDEFQITIVQSRRGEDPDETEE